MATLPLPARSDFLVALDRRFRARRLDLLTHREEQAALAPTPLAETTCIRETEWQAVCRAAETTTHNVFPRPWSATATVDGTEVSAATYDVGSALYDLALEQMAPEENASPVRLHLPDIRDHRGARVWNDLFDSCQQRLGLGRGTVHALVRIAGERSCVEIDEIIYELREHIVAVVNTIDDQACQELVSATCTRRGVLQVAEANSTAQNKTAQNKTAQDKTAATAAA